MLYPPFDSSRFAGSVDAHSGSPSALVVSRLLPYKRVDIAIRACALAGIPLTIIGRGPDEDRLRSIAPELVTFAGSVTDDELIDAYDKHSMVLVPGIEDFGYIPLEAASRGRPVVAAREGGPAETVVDGTTGILVAGADPRTWADALLLASEAAWSVSAMRRSVVPFEAHHFDDGVLRGLRVGAERAARRARPRLGPGVRDLSSGRQSCRVPTKSRNFLDGSTPRSASIRSHRPTVARTRLRLPASRCSVANWM